ncbi:MAG: hypothetical protein ACK5LG_21795 [Bacteroides thetaiotaomicron]
MIKSTEGMIFVFGSNLSGIHGAGAAYYARRHKGAKMGKGKGLHGQSYALPTKGVNISFMPLEQIEVHIDAFKDFAMDHPELDFQVTQVACGLAGFNKGQIAPLFQGSPSNCYFDLEWQPLLGDEYNYWA